MDTTKAIVNFMVASEGRYCVEAEAMCSVLMCFYSSFISRHQRSRFVLFFAHLSNFVWLWRVYKYKFSTEKKVHHDHF